ncbi:MAG: VanW family protein [Candidatus Kerfeldbacteria bacterium]|nr:VanW family protein [Candidatus Kerfeldbacteria bacterium]
MSLYLPGNLHKNYPIAGRLGLLLVLFLLLIGGISFYHKVYAGRIFPGVFIGSLSVGGLTPEAAAANLRAVWNSFSKQGLQLTSDVGAVTMMPIVGSSTNPDLSYELVSFDPETAVEQAYAIGRQGSWPRQFVQPFITLFNERVVSVEADTTKVAQFIKDSLPKLEVLPQPARLVWREGDFTVEPEVPGRVLNESLLHQALEQRFKQLAFEPIELVIDKINPSLNQAKVMAALPQARKLAQDNDLVFTFAQQSWTAKPSVWHKWLEVREDNNAPQVGLSLDSAKEFFKSVTSSVDQPALNAKFEFKDGVVTTFTASQPGQVVDLSATLQAAEVVVKGGELKTVPLVVKVTEPEISTAEANELGIVEIIGVGRSNFAGSPSNRRHNIRTGANKLNGILVKPDEEFSLIKALGKIDAAAGYKEELVIKGNKTIPEFGGGLCQIGTTTFRAALASGLPILERRNHSYRVPYYEPAGTDATIYDPKPDFRFGNDTGSAILIQTRIEGDNLIFEFWGKKDGRLVEQTKPKITNLVAPPPTKLVETEDLPVGQKKCTERAHTGADAEFTYTVTYSSGEKKEQVFKSHYVPWQEVCLVGVPKGSLQQTTDNNTTLPSADVQGQTGN